MNQNGGIHKGGFAVLCHRNGGSESPGILSKEQLEVAEWCLVSPRQVRNWIRKDTNISVMNLYSLADCPECKTDDLVISLPMPEGKE